MQNMFRVTKISWKTIVWKTRRDPYLKWSLKMAEFRQLGEELEPWYFMTNREVGVSL